VRNWYECWGGRLNVGRDSTKTKGSEMIVQEIRRGIKKNWNVLEGRPAKRIISEVPERGTKGVLF